MKKIKLFILILSLGLISSLSFTEEGEEDEAKLLWDNNVVKLKQAIGG